MRSFMKTHFGFVVKENAKPNNSIWHESCQILSPRHFFTVSPKLIITVCGESRRKQTTERIYKINQLSVTPCEGPCQLRGRLQFRRCFYCLCCVSVNLTVRNGLKAHLCAYVFIIPDQLSCLDLFVIPHGLYIVSRCNTDAHHWNKYTAVKTVHQKWKYVIIYVCLSFKTCMFFVLLWNTKEDYVCI